LTLIVIVFGVLWFRPASAQNTTGQSAFTTQQYLLGPGDQLRMIVFGHDDLSGEFEIDGVGLVSLPLIGKIRAGGKTIAEAESAIIEALKPDYLKNPHVSLQILNYRPFYIIGEVRTPGSYPYVNGMTVLEAVAIAGGFTYRAKESRMKITRATDATRQKNLASPATAVLPGDVIEVPERFF
jgi:polysaccharide export outer membrane protein